jgi:hypothetical protein
VRFCTQVDGVRSGSSIATTSYSTPQITALSPPLITTASQVITLTGVNFGPLGTTIVATYGLLATPTTYSASGCAVSVAHTQITCNTADGVGTSYVWRVTIAGQSNSVVSGDPTSSYFPPVITAVTSASPLLTVGGTVVSLTGTNFGPLGTSASVTYTAGSLSYSMTCSVSSHTYVTCTTVAGVGKLFAWTLNVGSQTSVQFIGSVSYAVPTISSLSTSGGTLNTAGSEVITVNGANFGPPSTPTSNYALTYGPSGIELVSTGPCTVSQNRVTCTSVAGVGRNFVAALTVAGQSTTSVATISYSPPTISSVTSNMPTQGGTAMTLTGTNFGPLSSSNIWSILGLGVTASYGPPSNSAFYTANACSVSIANTRMICVSVEGVGKNHVWVVTVGTQVSAVSTATSSYDPPQITGLIGTSPTSGGSLITINGSSFGPVSGNIPFAQYGPTGVEFAASSCAIVLAHLQITCLTAPGYGGNLVWTVTIGGETSVVSLVKFAYDNPVINTILPDLMSTSGQLVTLTGLNFGTVASGATLSVTYGPSGALTTYSSSSCAVTVAHFEVQCVSSPGVGANLFWQVTLQGLSGTSGATNSYYPPSIVSLSTFPVTTLRTSGGESVTIDGSHFGPLSALPTATYAGGSYSYTASSCTVSISHTQIVCLSSRGVGANLLWQVSVGGQLSSFSSDQVSYTRPAVVSISPIVGPSSRYGVLAPTLLTLTGTNFGDVGTVNFSDGSTSLPCSWQPFSWLTITKIFCQVPGLTSDLYSVTLSIGGQTATTSPHDFYVFELDALVPAYAPIRGGTLITVIGLNLYSDPSFTVSVKAGTDATATGTITSNSTITFVTPALPSGATSINVQLNGQQWVPTSITLDVYPPASVSALSPQSGPLSGGTSVAVTGSFHNTGTVSIILDPGVAVVETPESTPSAVYISSSSLSFTSLSFLSSGSFYVRVSVDLSEPIYSQDLVNFQYYIDPVVTRLFPPLGPEGGSTVVTVCGDDFIATEDIERIKFRDAYASNVNQLQDSNAFYSLHPSVSRGCFVATAPSLTSVDENASVVSGPLPYPVEIALNGVQFTNDNVLFYYYQEPVLINVSPTTGCVGGTLAITITGTGFLNASSISSLIRVRSSTNVNIESNWALGEYVSSSVLILSSPAVALGVTTASLQISLNAQQFSPSSVSFNYYDPPSLAALSPRSGPILGGTLVTLSGSFNTFSGLVDAKFDNIFVSCAYTSIGALATCVTPSFSRAVSVNAEATVDSLEHAVRTYSVPLPFLVYPEPHVTKADPWLGPLVVLLDYVIVIFFSIFLGRWHCGNFARELYCDRRLRSSL